MAQALYFKAVRPGAVIPSYGSAAAIGLDLYACDTHLIGPRERCAIPLGVACRIPDGYYGRIAPRSGLALRNGLGVLAGVIDPDFRGELVALVINHGAERISIHPQNRVAQLILERADRLDPVEVTELPASARALGGFGSTGA